MKIFPILALISMSAFGQAATLSLVGPASVKPGATVTVNINLATAGASVSGVQFSFLIPPSTLVAGSAATSAQKSINFPVDRSVYYVLGFNGTTATNAPFGNGTIATATFVVPSGTAPGNWSMNLSNVLSVDTAGLNVATTSVPLNVIVTSACDVDDNGTVTSSDVQAAINQKRSILEIVQVLIASLGGTCRL